MSGPGVLIETRDSNPDLARELQCKVTLKKLGLQPSELEDSMEHKIRRLIEQWRYQNNMDIDVNATESLLKKSIKKVKHQFSSIRQPDTYQDCPGKVAHNNPGSIEEDGFMDYPVKGKSKKFHMKVGKKSRRKIQADTARRQKAGDMDIDKKLAKHYHVFQGQLFEKLHAGNVFPDDITFDENGQMFANMSRLTTEQFCNALDDITMAYFGKLQEFVKLRKSDRTVSNYMRQFQYLIEVTSDCSAILRGRIVGDWGVANDLMNPAGYNKWKSHVIVIISFAALRVVLKMLKYAKPAIQGAVISWVHRR